MVAKEHFSVSTGNGFGGLFWAFCYITMQQSAASRRLLHFSAAVVLITLLTKSCSDYFCDKSCSDYSCPTSSRITSAPQSLTSVDKTHFWSN